MPPFLVLALIAQVAATPDPVTTYGPWAVLSGVIGALWKLHLDADSRDRDRLETALAGWSAQREANDKLADLIEADRAELRTELAAIKQKLERKA